MSRALKSLAIFFVFVAIYTLSRHGTSHAPSTSTTSTVSQTTTVVTTAPTPHCQGSDFRGAFNEGQGAAGTIYASITLLKNSPGTCTIKGWPTLTLQDRTGAVLPSTSVDVPSSASPVTFADAKANAQPTSLTLSTGSMTTFSLAYSDVPVGNETCGSATSIAVALSSGGSTVSITPNYPQQPCDHGRVWVSPFY